MLVLKHVLLPLGKLIDTASVKGLLGKIDIDERNRVYNLDAKIMIDRTKDHVTYTPQIRLDIQDWKNIQLTGGINYKQKESFDADLLITGAQDTPIIIQSNYTDNSHFISAGNPQMFFTSSIHIVKIEVFYYNTSVAF